LHRQHSERLIVLLAIVIIVTASQPGAVATRW